MTAVVVHQPSHRLPMSPINSNTRRLSARIQEKEASLSQSRADHAVVGGSRTQASASSKKRKVAYEEEDDGFAFTRIKKPKKVRPAGDEPLASVMVPVHNEVKTRTPVAKPTASKSEADDLRPMQRRRPRMSFSTPKPKEAPSQRRSKRLSTEAGQRDGSPALSNAQTVVRRKRTADGEAKIIQQEPRNHEDTHSRQKQASSPQRHARAADETAGTKITLPMSDTPVIRRNKAMREGRGSKGERRSSLGLRGRRASSLIDTGNSNALPHREVPVGDFYKHIEGDLLEPKRMRQLLTWCATRAMHAKPQGSEFDDTHKIMSARAIEEELLKELANKPALSDWFGRDDIATVKDPLPQRPNPKNIQNIQKIGELEQQIEWIRKEKEALEALLKPAHVTELPSPAATGDFTITSIDQTLLSKEDVSALELLMSNRNYSTGVAQRVNKVTSNLGLMVDAFADGMHKIAQYRTAADRVASQILSSCAEKFAQRESEGRRKALQIDHDRSPARDMSSVLRGLSRVDR